MDVYLVPIGGDRYELYCEVPDEPHEVVEEPPKGFVRTFFRRMHHRFRTMLADAERERRQGQSDPVRGGWTARFKARSMRWVAESIAEQRLLWHIRRQTHGHLFYPDDIEEAHATRVLRTQLGRDFDKHRFWLIIDSIGFIASGLLMLVPGPNLVAYYFAFRLVGHFLSLRGAKQGLNGILWTHERSAPLSDLRHAIDLEEEVRDRRVLDVASRLRLDHLASFFKRTAVAP
jgi:hypothetical protein